MKSWVGLKVFSPSSSWSNAWHQVWENKEGLTQRPQVRAWAQHFLMIQDNSGPRFSSKWNRSEMLNKSRLKVSKSLCPWLSLPYSAAGPGTPLYHPWFSCMASHCKPCTCLACLLLQPVHMVFPFSGTPFWTLLQANFGMSFQILLLAIFMAYPDSLRQRMYCLVISPDLSQRLWGSPKE